MRVKYKIESIYIKLYIPHNIKSHSAKEWLYALFKLKQNIFLFLHRPPLMFQLRFPDPVTNILKGNVASI